MEGVPQRLYLLPVVTTATPFAGIGGVHCYLIQTTDRKNILIDTGLPAEYQSPHDNPDDVKKSVVEYLAALGLQPNDIDILVCTHFDVDHSGYHDAFPNAELVVQREQYELAKSGHPRFAASRAHWNHPSLHYRLIEGDVELLPGITLLETSGHTSGHQSLLVRLPHTGTVLLTIDAVAVEQTFTPTRNAWPLDDNETQLRASTQKLLDIVEREQVALVVFGHDAAQWEGLKKAPEYYD